MTPYDMNFVECCRMYRKTKPSPTLEEGIHRAHLLINADPLVVEQVFRNVQEVEIAIYRSSRNRAETV